MPGGRPHRASSFLRAIALLAVLGGCECTRPHAPATPPSPAPPSRAPGTSAHEEWPGWRGPRGDGISQEGALARAWPPDGLRRAWKVAVGNGFASPIGVGGRILLFHGSEEGEHLTAFDANTGAIQWDVSDAGGWGGERPGPRATPAVRDGVVYTYGGQGELTARQLATGALLWRRNVLREVGATTMLWGLGSSPVVDAQAIYVQTGQGGPIGVAVKRETGAILWQSEERGIAGYAPPVLLETYGKRQLILAAAQRVVAMDPSSGKTLWTVPFHMEEDIQATTPVFGQGGLFVTSSFHAGAMLLDVQPTNAAVRWKTPHLQSRVSAGIEDGGYLYMNNQGKLSCIDWATGEIVWAAETPEMRLGDAGTIVRVEDRIIALSDRGNVLLVAATPTKHELLGHFQATAGTTVLATPLLYRDRLYIRGEQELTAWELPLPSKEAATASSGK